jgi:hypothetical protein
VTHPAGTCPNCGAPVEFQWSSAVQTVCSHCRSVLVRRDLDLAKVGVVADLPPDVSPIQIGTTGRFAEAAFTVTGRIVYEYAAGTWNEWHLLFADGSSGWLSDAQLDYAITRPLTPTSPLPEASAFTTGQRFTFNGMSFAVTTLTRARYRGVEGELPFEYWDKTEVLFVDLASDEEQLATVDYSEAPPLLFVGQFVGFDALALKNLRPAPAGPEVKAAGFNCRNCGAAIELRALGLTRTVACTSCGAIQDPGDPNIVILQQAAASQKVTPTIPLGTVGVLDGHGAEVIGFQRRTIEVDDQTYGWNEYLLFNREQGFRYLSEYEGHWSDIRVVHGIPRQWSIGRKPSAMYQGHEFLAFQTATATTAYVLGEFPWQVRAGDTAVCSDYVDPPLMLSAEKTVEETTWSLGRYTTGREIWKAFKLGGDPPQAVGVYANQPSPYAGKSSRYWTIFIVLALLLLIEGGVRMISAARQPVFTATYTYQPGAADTSFVTPIFDIGPRPSNVEVSISTNARNNWIYFDLALINADSGDAFDFGREVSYYFGTDSDGSWTEGSNRDDAVLPTTAPGRYYLRVEPETEKTSVPVSYTITVRRDVPSPLYYLIGLVVLAIPPVLVWMREKGFERLRWSESDWGE